MILFTNKYNNIVAIYLTSLALKSLFLTASTKYY